MNTYDPANKRVAFIGWSDSTTIEDRIKDIEKSVKLHAPNFRILECDNFYNGPYNDRKPTKVAYAEFSSRDVAKRVLERIHGHEFKVGGNTIAVKEARTKLNGQRNFSLRKAHELIQASPETLNKTVTLQWKERRITVNKVVAFSQDKAETGGTFVVPYESIVLPP